MSIEYLFESRAEKWRCVHLDDLSLLAGSDSSFVGSIMFKVVKCPSEYIEIRKRLRAQESALDNIQAPSIQDRTINDHLSMFVEVKNG